MNIVAALYLAGGVFPLTGLAWAFRNANRQYKDLREKLHFLDRIVARTGPNPTQEDIRYWLNSYGMKAPEAEHPAQWMYAPEIAQKAIWSEIRRPAYLAGTGVLLGTAGSLLALPR